MRGNQLGLYGQTQFVEPAYSTITLIIIVMSIQVTDVTRIQYSHVTIPASLVFTHFFFFRWSVIILFRYLTPSLFSI